MLVAENWCVKVEDRVYGPYTSQQLRRFASEGRLAGWSLIAPAGSRSWREARQDPAFAPLFTPSEAPTRAFGRRDEPAPASRRELAAKPADLSAARVRKQSPGESANFVLVFDVVSGAAARVDAVVNSLGPAFRLADNVWALSSELTAVGVRNAVTPYLQARESIFVVDTTRGRSSWQNYGPETHSKIAAAWMQARA